MSVTPAELQAQFELARAIAERIDRAYDAAERVRPRAPDLAKKLARANAQLAQLLGTVEDGDTRAQRGAAGGVRDAGARARRALAAGGCGLMERPRRRDRNRRAPRARGARHDDARRRRCRFRGEDGRRRHARRVRIERPRRADRDGSPNVRLSVWSATIPSDARAEAARQGPDRQQCRFAGDDRPRDGRCSPAPRRDRAVRSHVDAVGDARDQRRRRDDAPVAQRCGGGAGNERTVDDHGDQRCEHDGKG